MLKSRHLFSSFNRNIRIDGARFSSKPAQKVLGYHEKPDELEITADYIGEYDLAVFATFLCKTNLILGPPDKKSNIRPVLRYIPDNETKLEYELRTKRIEVHDWVDKFWRNHNKRFTTEKDEFIAKNKQPGEDSVSADKMSEFYKAFLDKNHKVHVYFNISWYIKNFTLMFTALQVFLHNRVRKIRGK